MNKKRMAVILLILALIGTNLWWAYQALDQGITFTYQEDSLRANKYALDQALALLPIVSRPGITRDEILEAAIATDQGREPFEKEGFVWVGGSGITLRRGGAVGGGHQILEPSLGRSCL